MASRLRQLFQRGDHVEHAFIVEHGPIYLELPGLEVTELPGQNLLVGTLELFLNDLLPRNPERLFTLSVLRDDVVQAVKMEAVLDLLIDFDFGFHTNCFLARLLELSNQAQLAVSRKLNQDVRKYKVRGIHFALLIDDLRELAAIPALNALRSIVSDGEKSSFYQDGCIFSREHKYRAVNVAPEFLTESVHVHRKNSEICREGGLADTMFVLLEGSVAVTKEGRYIATIQEAGEAFGEAFLFLSGRRSATLIAETDTKVFALRREDLPKFYRRHRDLFVNIAYTLARRIHDNIERTVRFGTLLDSSHSVDQESWKQLRSFHEQLNEMQRKLHSDTLRQILNKHSVV